MPADLKSFFDRPRVARIADELRSAWPGFPRAAFVREASAGLDRLGLLDRGRHIAAAMARALPVAYPEALDVVVRSLGPPLARPTGNGMEPFHYLPHTIFVERHGLDHPDISFAAQRELTRRFSCESSIRAFLLRHPEQTMRQLRAWARDPDEHVRRLVSEGTRPRLPWAVRLPAFQRDPTPVLALLEILKDDPSEYVRRSVANNLNDVSKDAPDATLSTCARWLEGASPERRRLVLHALRSLVRAGHPDAVRLAGGDAAARVAATGSVEPARVRIGESVRVVVGVTNLGSEPTTVVLGVRIHFVKARGQSAPRSFKLPTTRLAPGASATLRKAVSLKQHTTRTHHAGRHEVELVVNGRPQRLGSFVLTDAKAPPARRRG